MNRKQVQKFVMRYLEATGCHIIEAGAGHVTVKLSPQADKALTGRSYYWSFVERTGAPPETMTFLFVFDPEQMPAPQPAKKSGFPGESAASAPAPKPDVGNAESILGRYFGVAASTAPGTRIPREEVTFGSRRLSQLFAAAHDKGRFVRLFEEPAGRAPDALSRSAGYHTWLAVNYKVELTCDMKRSELHSLGIHLSTGEIVEQFQRRIERVDLTPQLPEGLKLQPTTIDPARASEHLESYLSRKIRRYDHRWADEALERLAAELARIDDYYREQLGGASGEQRKPIDEQYENRRREIDWQYRPKIVADVVNCGLFHLANALPTESDLSR